MSSIPSVGEEELVSCSVVFVSPGRKFAFSSNSSAAAPLTTALAMLVPDNCMYPSAPLPLTCRCGYV